MADHRGKIPFRQRASRNDRHAERCGKKYGFHVEVLPAVNDENGRISSSCIRKALEESDFPKVAELLEKPYMMSGHVVHGDKIGRDLGFPTANLPIRHYNPILSGVFITQVHGLSDEPLPSVSMIGTRPTDRKATGISCWKPIFWILTVFVTES